jgi:hypothetical protein
MECMSNVIDLDRRLSADALVGRFIEASGARLSDQIVIAGAAYLEPLIALTRRGFSRAICQSPDRGPHVPNSTADAILAPAVESDAQLLSILAGLGANLRPGGTLVLEAPMTANFAGDALCPALRAKGFASLEPLGGGLWRLCKQDSALMRAA